MPSSNRIFRDWRLYISLGRDSPVDEALDTIFKGESLIHAHITAGIVYNLLLGQA